VAIGVPQYAQIKYQNLYPGVDLVYYGNQRQLEFDFVIAPQVNPEVIRLSFSAWIGSISTGTATCCLRRRPASEAAKAADLPGSSGRQKEHRRELCPFRSDSDRLQVAAYDRSKPLVIDPVVLSYSTFLGGTGDDQGNAIAVDTSGNVTLQARRPPPTFPLQAALSRPVPNAFVARLNAPAQL